MIILAELFTFARCTYCPYAEDALDSLVKEFGDSLAVVAYHRRVAGDTLSPSYVAVRESLYQIDVSPIVVFDGVHQIQTEDPQQDYPAYKNLILSERNIEPEIGLFLNVEQIGSSCTVEIGICPLDSIGDGDHRLFLVVCEDSVYFSQVGASDTFFNFVMREMLPDQYGRSVTLPAPQDTVLEQLNFVLDPGWNEKSD